MREGEGKEKEREGGKGGKKETWEGCKFVLSNVETRKLF